MVGLQRTGWRPPVEVRPAYTKPRPSVPGNCLFTGVRLTDKMQSASPPDQCCHQSQAPTDNCFCVPLFVYLSLCSSLLLFCSLFFSLPMFFFFSFGIRLIVSDLFLVNIFFFCFVCLTRHFYSILFTSFLYLLYFPFSLSVLTV